MDDYCDESTMLETSVNISDLINGGARFTLQSNLQEYNEEDENFPELLTGEEGIELDDTFKSPWDRPFSELKPSMTEFVIPDNYGNQYTIYKKIVQQPIDNVEINGRCRVTIDYNAYGELETIPFDSTRMRGSTFTFVTDDQSILPGFMGAVCSMKQGEESQFIIPYQLLYGKQGCAPRVKKEADALFDIRLIQFSFIGDEDATEKLISNEDRRKYSVMIRHIMDVKASGIDAFKRGAYLKAVKIFHKAIDNLRDCRLANEEEEAEWQNHLIKLHVNAMTIYNKLDKPNKVCSLFNDLTTLPDVKRNAKAHFQHGKALMSLGEYKRAKVALKTAYHLKPNDSDIVALLKTLDKKNAAYKSEELNLWRNAFPNNETINSAPEASGLSEEFKATVNEVINEFKNDSTKSEQHIPSHLNDDEQSYIRELVKDFNMKLVIPPPVQGKKVCYLSKNA